MSERPKRASKQEPFTYSLYLPSSQKSDRPKAELNLRNQEGYLLEEPTVAEDSSAMMGLQSTVQEATMVEVAPSQDLASTHSNGIYRPKYHSLRNKSLFGRLHFGGAFRMRIGAVVGWTALAGSGAVALLTRAGPFPGTQLAELGAVWGSIAAFLWIILAKFSK